MSLIQVLLALPPTSRRTDIRYPEATPEWRNEGWSIWLVVSKGAVFNYLILQVPLSITQHLGRGYRKYLTQPVTAQPAASRGAENFKALRLDLRYVIHLLCIIYE